MTERVAQNATALFWRQKYELLLPCYTPHGWFECDLFAVTRAQYSWEIEIKLSIPDFKKDAEKGRDVFVGRDIDTRKPVHRKDLKHDMLAGGDPTGPSRFSYCVPEGMIAVEDVPDWAGLLYLRPVSHSCQVKPIEVKKAPRLHKTKVRDAVMTHARSVCYHRYWTERLRGVA